MKFLCVIAFMFAVLLSGCSTLGHILTPANEPIVNASIDVAVAVAVGNDYRTQASRAAVIQKAATDLLATDTGGIASVLDVEKLVNVEAAKLKLPPAENLTVQVLTAAFTAAINQQIQQQVDAKVTPDTKVAIAAVLNQVILATKAYAKPA